MANRPYDWLAIGAVVRQERMTGREAMARFGFSSRALAMAVRRGEVQLQKRRSRMTREELLAHIQGRRATPKERSHIRRHIAAERGYRCEGPGCGLSEWMGKRLCLEVDHIDGNPRRHDWENLRLLCPNCHSITDTWRGRNARK